MSYIARFIVNIRSVSRLFARVFLIYQAMRTIEKVDLKFLAVIFYQSGVLVLACHEFLVLVYK